VTPDMAFECLLGSRDPKVVCPLNHLLDNLSISTTVCLIPSKAVNELRIGNPDLVVIDWVEEDSAAALLDEIRQSDVAHKKTVVAVSCSDRTIPGVYVVLTRPITAESGTRGLRMAYQRMLRDYRQRVRYAVMTPVIVRVNDQLLPLTVTNIGDGGVGLSTTETLTIGDVLSFHLPLPGARRSVYVEARVLWTREYNAAGCEFVRIPPMDLDILHEWFKEKCRVKKPLLAL
jgi:PilZ domain